MKRLQQIAFATVLAAAIASPALAGNIDFGKKSTGNIDFGKKSIVDISGKDSSANIDFGSVLSAALMLIGIL